MLSNRVNRTLVSSLLRQSRALRALHGNGIVGIRREDKNEWERRTPLTPEQVGSLIDDYDLRVLVQPSNNRCFTNDEYAAAGAVISEELDECGTILAVKEVPIPLLKADRTYAFFSHTIKGQADNMPLLQSLIDRNIRMVDYERIIDHDGERLVKFGPFAGYAGVVDTLHAVGRACLERGFATPFLYISRAAEYRSLQAARNDVFACGEDIRKYGLPKELLPFNIVVTGTGSVSMAAQQMLHPLPCLYVSPDNLVSLANEVHQGNHRRVDPNSVYVTVVSAAQMVESKAGSVFNKREYYAHPDKYRPVFHRQVLPYTSVLINGMFWAPRFPRLVTTRQAMNLHNDGALPLLALGDITCDPCGSVEFFHKSTPISDPFYTWDPATGNAYAPHEMSREVRKRAVWVMGVDHLPAEFPTDASRYFGKALLPFAAALARNAGGVGDPRTSAEPLPSREARKTYSGMPPELAPAVVTEAGQLTPAFDYLAEPLKRVRQANRTTGAITTAPVGSSGPERQVLVLGAGMSAGPAVQALLEDERNNVVLVDASESNLRTTVERWANSDQLTGGRGVPAAAAGASKRVRTVAGSASDKNLLKSLISKSDLVVSLVPWHMHPQVLEVAVEEGVNVQTASYQTPAMAEFDAKAKAKGVTILNECGLDPGLDIMSTVEFLDGIRAEGGVIESYSSMCGALTAPECSTNALRYKFSWSPGGVIAACQRPAEFLSGGQTVSVPPEMTYNLFKPFDLFPALQMEAVPNGNSVPYIDIFGLHDAETVVRGTLRFPGFSDVFRALIDLGVCGEDAAPKGTRITWGDVFGASSQGELVSKIAAGQQARRDAAAAFKRANPHLKSYLGDIESPYHTKPAEEIANAITAELDMGLATPIKPTTLEAAGGKDATRKGILTAHLSQLSALQLTGDDADFVVLAHEVEARYGANQRKMHRSVLLAHGASAPFRSVVPYLVGAPCGYAAQLQLDGRVVQQGLVRPIHRDIYLPILQKHGYKFHESAVDIAAAE